MSRWDSLKPDSNRTRRSSNNRTTSSRNNPQHGRASTASSRPAGRHPIQPSDRRQTAGGTGNSVNDFSRDNLKQQVALYRANNKTFQPTSVVKALEDFHRCLTSRGRIEVTGDDVMLLIDLIEINDSAIHQLCVDNLELAFEKDTFISMTKTQARHCTTVLAEKCMSSSTASMLIKCLSHIILVQAKTLPAEETAQDLVGRVFVPFLQNTTTNVSTLTSICTTLAGLFQDPGHASALLAPLVNDVSADGKEQRVVNPLRRKILNALQNILYSTSSDHDSLGQVAACNSLVKAIDALRKIDGDLNTSVNSADIDWALMERFLLEAMESHSSTLFTPALILLRAMIGRYPNATTRLGSRLIMEPVSGIRSMGKGGKCSCCSKLCNEIGLLLDIAHTRIATPNTINGETKNLAVHCLADFLQSMPWKKWQNASKQDTAHQRSSGFGRKVFDSLETVIQITRCTLLRCDEISIESIARLAGTIFTEISFNENKVVDAGIELWSTLANLVIHTTTKPKIQHATTDVLVLSMGGRCTPQGDLLPMCAPGYAWLSNESSETFLCKLFDSLESNDSLSHHSFKLLSAILRTRPETAYDWWERFQGLLEKYSKNDGSGVKFVQVGLLESFMLGKRDFPTDAAHGTISVMLVELLCCVLEKARIDNHVQSRTLSFNVYAALQRSDWIVLDKEEKRLLSHFNAIISHCRESNAKVRIAACKAAGDFCTQYIATETSVDRCRFQMISHDVCETMLACLNDKNGSVRSMVSKDRRYFAAI